MSSVRFRHPAHSKFLEKEDQYSEDLLCQRDPNSLDLSIRSRNIHRCLTPDVYHHSVELSDRDIAIIDFERSAWRLEDSKEAAIREIFGLSPSRYYQIRNTILDTDEALRYDPLVILRLRRQRTQRRSTRLGIPLIQSPIR